MKTLVVIGLVLLGVYGCYAFAIPSATVRYKLTLTVDDNGKQYTGSGVIQVSREDTTKVFGGSLGGVGYDFKGEAVTVDIGDKGVLFALLKGDEKNNPDHYSNCLPPYIIIHAFGAYSSGNASVIDSMGKLNHDKPKATLPLTMTPMLVHFRDINDQKTVELVDPKDLSASFGAGVKLVSATIEITDESVTTGLDKRLGWFRTWQKHGGTIIRGEMFPNSPPPPEELLIPIHFIQE